jgi:hypothetical protein
MKDKKEYTLSRCKTLSSIVNTTKKEKNMYCVGCVGVRIMLWFHFYIKVKLGSSEFQS